MKIYREFTDAYRNDESLPFWERTHPADALMRRMDERIKECRDAFLIKLDRQETMRAEFEAAARIDDPAVREAVRASLARSISKESLADVIDKSFIVPPSDEENGEDGQRL